jgi:hypothetical protein
MMRLRNADLDTLKKTIFWIENMIRTKDSGTGYFPACSLTKLKHAVVCQSFWLLTGLEIWFRLGNIYQRPEPPEPNTELHRSMKHWSQFAFLK